MGDLFKAQLLYAKCLGLDEPKADEGVSGDDKGGNPSPLKLNGIVDSPRRTRASISHRSQEDLSSAQSFLKHVVRDSAGCRALVERFDIIESGQTENVGNPSK